MKLGMLVHHQDLECHAKTLGPYLQGHGHSVGSSPQKITCSSELGITTSWSVVCQFWMAVLKFKVTVSDGSDPPKLLLLPIMTIGQLFDHY